MLPLLPNAKRLLQPGLETLGLDDGRGDNLLARESAPRDGIYGFEV